MINTRKTNSLKLDYFQFKTWNENVFLLNLKVLGNQVRKKKLFSETSIK